jgi:hypothetical protein
VRGDGVGNGCVLQSESGAVLSQRVSAIAIVIIWKTREPKLVGLNGPRIRDPDERADGEAAFFAFGFSCGGQNDPIDCASGWLVSLDLTSE